MSAQAISILSLTLQAQADLAARRFVGGNGQYAGLSGDAVGVTQYAAEDGGLVAVDVAGTAVVEAGGAISPGDLVGSDATGRAVPLGINGDIGALGRATDAAALAGDSVEVLLLPRPAVFAGAAVWDTIAGGAVTTRRFVTATKTQAGEDANTAGVALATAASGARLLVATAGVAAVEAGASFAAGVRVSSDAQGRAAATDDSTYNVVSGRALDAAGAPGDLVLINLVPN